MSTGGNALRNVRRRQGLDNRLLAMSSVNRGQRFAQCKSDGGEVWILSAIERKTKLPNVKLRRSAYESKCVFCLEEAL